MDPLAIAQGYFDAWNARDPAAIVATFAAGGTYTDPLAGTLSGPAIGAYAAGLFTAFPDLSFEIISAARTGDGTVAAQWMMTGTNSGPFQGAPASGRGVAVPGADFITVDGAKVSTVQGYFDSRAAPEQLGLQVLVQPRRVGPFVFGTSTHAHSGSTARPGAFSLTVLTARSPEEVETVRGYSRRVVQEMLAMPGFISWLGVIVGDRMFTITAWEKPEDLRPLMRGGAHKEAMARFFETNLAACASTSVWLPHHLNPLWVRCTACHKLALVEGDNPAAAAAPRCRATRPTGRSWTMHSPAITTIPQAPVGCRVNAPFAAAR